jgi:hypothetical protein
MSRRDVDVVGALTEPQETPHTVELEDLSAGTATFPDQTATGPPIDGGYPHGVFCSLLSSLSRFFGGFR